MTLPNVGTMVYWYGRGNTTAAPLPALVVASHPGGMLSLNACDAYGHWSFKACVWRTGSTAIVENPKLSFKDGCWDYIPSPFVPEVSPVMDQTDDKPKIKAGLARMPALA